MTKRIHNPKTGRYLKLRERTTKLGRREQIMGNWEKKFSSALKKLSSE